MLWLNLPSERVNFIQLQALNISSPFTTLLQLFMISLIFAFVCEQAL